MAWPARSTLPGLAYDVSDLQQRSKELTVSELVRANGVLRMAKDMVERDVGLFFPARGELKPSIICAHDASFARQPNEGSQQGYMIMASDTDMKGNLAVLIDWCSSKIHRVTKSTLAAEAAAASYGFDRAVFARAVLAEILYGWPRRTKHWRNLVKLVGGLQVSDCRSLVDLCHRQGSLPRERRVALDAADLREGLEEGTKLQWTNTENMVADPLTKHFAMQSVLEGLLRTASWHPRQDKK